MEEQILEIIKNHCQLSSKVAQKGAAKESTAHIKEFFTWLLKEDCYHKNIWGINLSSEYQPTVEVCNFICDRHGSYPVGVDDIYQYWLKKVKTK